MPSWKKVLISGSDAALNTLNVSTALTASGLIYPTVDGTSGQAIVTDGTGSLSFATIISGTGATTKLNQTVAATTWSFAHNLNEQYPVVTIYDSNDEVIVPEKIDAVDSNNLSVYFSSPVAGRAVAVVGGTTVSASLSQTASYVEYDNVVNKPTLISESIQIASDISGSFTSISSSIAGDIEDIIDGTTTVTSASYALTASYINPLNQNVDITGDLTVTGTVTAQEFHTELVSSSILYESGSTKFGDTTDDIHTFTGSILLSGSTVNFNVAWPDTGSEYPLLKTDAFTVSSFYGERTYNYAAIAMEHFEEDLQYEHNAFKIYMYDQDGTPEYGTNLLIGPYRAHLTIEASGSDSIANVSVRDLGTGETQALLYGTEVQLGVYNTERIYVGNNTSSLYIYSQTVEATSSVAISGALDLDGAITADSFTGIFVGALSSSAQITDLTTYKQTVSGSSTYTITHNLSEEFPIVQTYASSSKSQVIPQDVTSLNVNSVQIDFSSPFEGYVIIKK